MTISAETMYWILCLDNIRELCAIIILLTTLVLVFTSTILFTNSVAPLIKDKTLRVYKCSLCISLILFAGALIGNAFIPSTKQMAAIIVVPAVVNSKIVQEDIPREAKELYELTKDAMEEFLKKEKRK